jgi:hypothetical protein
MLWREGRVMVRRCRKRSFWIATILVAVGGAGALLHRSGGPELPGGPLYNETLEQVQAGMTREQVEAVVGPPRDAWRGHRASPYAFPYLSRGYEAWIGRDSVLLVLFDCHGSAADVQRVTAFCVHPPD